MTKQQYLQGTRYYVGYLDDNNKLVTSTALKFDDIQSTTYTAIQRSSATVTLKLGLVDSTLGVAYHHSYRLCNSTLYVPDATSPGLVFDGWYLNSDGEGGRVVYIRTDEKGNVFAKLDNENEEVNLGKSAFSLYAKYVGMDGYLGL